MKKLFLVLIILTFGFFSFIKVNGQEEVETQNETEETQTGEEMTPSELMDAIKGEIDRLTATDANWFENAIIEKIITFFMGLFGALGTVVVYLKKVKVINGDVVKAMTNNKKSAEELHEEAKKAIEVVKQQAEELGVSKQLIDKLDSAIESYKEKINEEVTKLSNKVEELGADNKAIIEILKIAFANNELLVKNGFANSIVKVVEKYENGKR